MGSHIVYIFSVEFQTFRLINCSLFNILTKVFSDIIYEPITVGLLVKIFKILKTSKSQRSACMCLERLMHYQLDV
jgi:hypothetical protein